MKFFSLLFLTTILLSNSQFAQHIEYFSTVKFIETPLSKIEGSIPLTISDALKRHHYRFSYSERNKLLAIEFFNGHVSKNPNHTANLFTLSHKMIFDCHEDKEEITFFDAKGIRTSVLGDVFKFIYSLDGFGRRRALHFENGDGVRIENDWGIYNYTWEYSREGYIIEDRFDKEGKRMPIRPSFEFYRLKLFFDSNGGIRLMQNIDEKGV